MKRHATILATVLAAAALGGCQSIHDPNVRPASYLPDGPTGGAATGSTVVCPGGDEAGPSGYCPSAKERQEAGQKRTSREILDIHAHGG